MKCKWIYLSLNKEIIYIYRSRYFITCKLYACYLSFRMEDVEYRFFSRNLKFNVRLQSKNNIRIIRKTKELCTKRWQFIRESSCRSRPGRQLFYFYLACRLYEFYWGKFQFDTSPNVLIFLDYTGGLSNELKKGRAGQKASGAKIKKTLYKTLSYSMCINFFNSWNQKMYGITRYNGWVANSCNRIYVKIFPSLLAMTFSENRFPAKTIPRNWWNSFSEDDIDYCMNIKYLFLSSIKYFVI